MSTLTNSNLNSTIKLKIVGKKTFDTNVEDYKFRITLKYLHKNVD